MLENESFRSERYGSTFSVAIIDVDKFKEINDRFGHITGDSVLKKLAKFMNNQKRNCDILARYGGDEFVFILPETTGEDAIKMIERIRKRVHEITVGDNYCITASGGIAQTLPGRAIIPTELMSRADIALYQAKQAGRDCTRIWNEDTAHKSKVISDK